ncbi:MAG TPA: tannase/feruloyl esterase family alpha/beta hydrolase [Pseudomonadaceae bacterium]|nr:tannase/feruloyl esterase family alpha/beta hydrolase [Pseudomonadaceae bacterium]
MKQLLASAILLATAPAVLAQAGSVGEGACLALGNASLEGVDLRITSAAHHQQRRMAAGPGGNAGAVLPAHCKLEGEIDRRTGADRKSYALRFAINMPDAWNGRFMFQGGGGLNGSLAEPLGTQATGGHSALERGFAVVSTDSGHEGAVFDSSFMADQEAALNFLFLGNMRVTVAAKPLVERYYSDAIQHSYFMGCSTGGREGMVMAQRYPYLFDGIVTGAPAIRTGHSNIGLRWFNVQLNRAVLSSGVGSPTPGEQFSAAERRLIVDGLLQSCDALDGASDGLVFNTNACDFDPRRLACAAGETEQCLVPEKAEALVQALAGPVDSRGLQVYAPFVLDTGNDDDTGFARGLLAGGANPPEGISVTGLVEQDVDAELAAATAPSQALGDTVATNLSSFVANGGKQIFYHGTSDAWFSVMDTVQYYESMATANGGLQTASDFSRLFLVPGMGHCQGGEQTLDSFDMLDAIVGWVENDEAPEAVTATGNSMPGVSRPLCAWPEYPHYDGSGDMDDADSFQCRL